MHLATAGHDIRIWDISLSSPSPTYTCNPHNAPVGQIGWTAGNEVIASAALSGNSIYLNRILERQETRLTTIQEETCLAFNSSTSYLVSGAKAGHIAIYSVKKLRLKRSYREFTSAVNSVLFTTDNSNVVGGYASGEIVVHNVSSGQVQATLALEDRSQVRQVGASLFNKSLLVSGHDNGAVALWDLTDSRPVNTFSSHREKVTGVVFSTFNEMLMISTGLDNSAVIYDVTSRISVQQIRCPGPATALDIAPDGKVIAIGTSTGQLLVYDLRNLREPQFTLDNASTINCLRFESIVVPSSSACDSQSSIATRISSIPSSKQGSQRASLLSVDEHIRSPLQELTDNHLTLREETSNISFGLAENSHSISNTEPNLLASLSFCSAPDDTKLSCSGISSLSLNLPSEIRDASCSESSSYPLLSPSVEVTSSKPSGKVTFGASPVKPTQHLQLDSTSQEVITHQSPRHEVSTLPVAAATDANLAKFREDLRADIRRDLQRFEGEIIAKIIKELVTTENNVSKFITSIIDDRDMLSEENEKLRKENELLKKTF